MTSVSTNKNIDVIRDNNVLMEYVGNTTNEMKQMLLKFMEESARRDSESSKLITHLTNEVNILKEESVKTNILLESMKEKLEKLENPKSGVKKKPRDESTRVQCSCFTTKGTRCTRFVYGGETMCVMHKRMQNKKDSDKPVVNEVSKTGETNEKSNGKKVVKRGKKSSGKKTKDPPPMHNHEPGEDPTEPCSLCESHGDIFDPTLPDHEFTGTIVDGKTLEERLRIAIEEEENESNITSNTHSTMSVEPEKKSWADMADEDDGMI